MLLSLWGCGEGFSVVHKSTGRRASKRFTRGIFIRLVRLSIAAVGLTLIAGAASPVTAHSLRDLEGQLLKRELYVVVTNREAPGFTLRDADGRTIRLADYRGKVVVLYFVYASCADVCPLHSDAIAIVQEAVNSTPMKDLVQFMTITTDPDRDDRGPQCLGLRIPDARQGIGQQ